MLTTPPSPNKARSGARQFGEWIVKMSKNTRDAKFRTVDVDEYDEDKSRDDAEAAEEESNEAGQLASRESEVKKLVSANNLTAALRAVLADPPINTKEVQLKARSFSLVLDVLTRFKAADVQKAVETLSSEELDVLVKYIYRGFAEPTENSCGILLTWHEKAVAVGGLGCIVRVLTDRKTV